MLMTGMKRMFYNALLFIKSETKENGVKNVHQFRGIQ
jgi:hypothetical protein